MIWASPPDDQPYGSAAYERFWATAQELAMPLSLHLATGRSKDSQQDESDIAELYVRMIIRPGEMQHSFLRLVFTGVLERFPQSQVCLRRRRYRLGAAPIGAGGQILSAV